LFLKFPINLKSKKNATKTQKLKIPQNEDNQHKVLVYLGVFVFWWQKNVDLKL